MVTNKTLKNVEPKEKYIMVCPICKSVDISVDNSDMLVGAVGIPANYICNNCQYCAKIFPEITEEEALKASPKAKNTPINTQTERIDTSYGKFMVNVWWKIIGPLGMIASIVAFTIYIQEQIIYPLIYSIGTFIGSMIITFLAYRKK